MEVSSQAAESSLKSYALTVPGLENKFPTFYATKSFITLFQDPPLILILSHMNPVHTLPSYFFKIPPIYALIFQLVSFLHVSRLKF
jgi:hypothetical protein